MTMSRGVARPQHRYPEHRDVTEDALAIDRPVEQPWRLGAIAAQGRYDAARLLMPVRHRCRQSLATGRPTTHAAPCWFSPRSSGLRRATGATVAANHR